MNRTKAGLTNSDLREMMKHMIAARVYSTRAFNLQRQGRAGTNAPVDGSEALVVGAAQALDPAVDWVVPPISGTGSAGAIRFRDPLSPCPLPAGATPTADTSRNLFGFGHHKSAWPLKFHTRSAWRGG